jgi:hypothetical protein
MWSKKWYLKRNVSCDAYLLKEMLETDVPWDDAIVVSAGKMRKLWDSLSELRSSLCERRLVRTVLRPALLPAKTAQITQFFRQVWCHTVKSLSVTEIVQGALLGQQVSISEFNLIRSNWGSRSMVVKEKKIAIFRSNLLHSSSYNLNMEAAYSFETFVNVYTR